MRQINQDNYLQVAYFLSKGFTQKEISEIVGVSIKTIKLYKRRLMDDPITENELAKWRWLKKHWQFTGRVAGNDKYIGTHKNGYRVVRKGEKGHLRTPYRTDYKFR